MVVVDGAVGVNVVAVVVVVAVVEVVDVAVTGVDVGPVVLGAVDPS